MSRENECSAPPKVRGRPRSSARPAVPPTERRRPRSGACPAVCVAGGTHRLSDHTMSTRRGALIPARDAYARATAFRGRLILTCLATALLALHAFPQESAPTSRAADRPVLRKIQVGDLDREYLLYIPLRAPPDRPLAVVLAFHGGGSRARQMEGLTGFVALARREEFIVVYPEGVNRGWNDGRVAIDIALRRDVDDVAFVVAILDALAKERAIDRKRVFATGISNGAIFSHYLAGNAADRIAAIAPVVGGIAEPFDRRFQPSHPVSVLIIQGTLDPLVPYAGGSIGGGRGRGRIVSTDVAVRLWTGANGCTGAPVTRVFPDATPDDECRVTVTRFDGGTEGASVELMKLDGGGHTWPGGLQYLPRSVIGRTCQDIDATRVI